MIVPFNLIRNNISFYDIPDLNLNFLRYKFFNSIKGGHIIEEIDFSQFEEVHPPQYAYARNPETYQIETPAGMREVNVTRGMRAQYAEHDGIIILYHNGFTLELDPETFEARYKRQDQ